jgi:hypothetical protein
MSFDTLDYTFSYSKYSCIKEFYWFHVICGYITGFCGLACLVSRAVPRLKKTHVYWGKGYVLFMLLTTAFSLLINNTGIPTGVLISFIWVLGGLGLGWIVIQFHQSWILKTALERLDDKLDRVKSLATAIDQEKGAIANERTLFQRMVSLKALHGVVMFVSWINILGQIGTGNVGTNFGCYTYPVYKNIPSRRFTPTNETITLVQEISPTYTRLPWANNEAMWGVQLSLGPAFVGLVVGTIFAYVSIRRSKK